MVSVLKKRLLVALLVIAILLSSLIVWNQRYELFYPLVHEVPYYQQETDYYCGEACIQMILAFYGTFPPKQAELAKEASFSGTETPCSGMLKPFQNRRFHVLVTTNTNFTDAYPSLVAIVTSRPVIVLITWKDQVGHYIVVFQFNQTGLFYHDPYYGSKRFRASESFKLLWLDYCLARPGQPTCWALIVAR